VQYRREIVIGDVHGCLEELDELLRVVEYREGQDRLVFCGDLVDRGPDPVGVVRRVRELGAECIMGNHEEKHVRWAGWQAKLRSGEVEKVPMQFSEKRLAEHNALSEEDMAFILAMPKMLRLNSDWIVVHAGFECDGTPPEDQKLSRVCRIRDLDVKGKKARNKEDFFAAAPGSVPWATAWKGPENVIYGHAVHSLVEPRVDNPTHDVNCFGIDTGCVYGGSLTALIIHPDNPSHLRTSLARVKAKRQYFKPPKNWRVGGPTSSPD
jgi:hypothetical protein